MKIRNINNRLDGIKHTEIDHRTHLHRNVIAGNDILRRNIKRYRPKINLDHFINPRNQDNKPWPFCPNNPSKTKNHSPLILPENFNR